MQQITRAIYLAEAGNEIATIEIDAFKVGLFVSFVVDGVAQTPVSATPRAYRFQVAVPVGQTHFGIIRCHFPKDAPADAVYQIFVTGSVGDTSRHVGSNIMKSDPVWSRDIQLRR
jgi:hypothetical protein